MMFRELQELAQARESAKDGLDMVFAVQNELIQQLNEAQAAVDRYKPVVLSAQVTWNRCDDRYNDGLTVWISRLSPRQTSALLLSILGSEASPLVVLEEFWKANSGETT